jgi:exodeoxyribonuclease VII large subunit
MTGWGMPMGGLLAQMELTPSQINDFLDEILKGLGPMTVVGEVQGVSKAGSGHLYFTLADPDQCVNCVTWRTQMSPATHGLKNGMLVRASVKSPAYMNRSGKVLLNVTAVESLGEGDLKQRAEEVRRRLEAEGLFERKRPLPYLPRVIGLISGHDSDGQKDVLKSIYERFPARVLFCGSLVQGVSAIDGIKRALQTLAAQPEVDVIVIARGGGSVEDRAIFNEEALARAVFASPVPVVTAIGHSQDVHIVDQVADRTCTVPSMVGEAVIPLIAHLLEDLDTARSFLSADEQARGLFDQLRLLDDRLGQGAQRVRWELDSHRGQLAQRQVGLLEGRRLIESARRDLDHSCQNLRSLDAFGRGFAVIVDAKGDLLGSASQLQPGAKVSLRLKDGSAATTIDSVTLNDPMTGEQNG